MPLEYSSYVINLLPINQILFYLERPENREAYKALYPTLISLVAASYPHFLDLSSFLILENAKDE
jgi:hypothetical protein